MRISVALAAATLALAVAAPVWADTGASDTPPAAADTTTTTTTDQQPSGTPDATPAATVDPSTDASGATVTPAPDNTSSGSTDASSSTDASLPQTPADPAGSAQSSDASASATQTGADNSSTTVRTGQGGNDGSVTQGNSDAATASSSSSGGTAPAAGDTSSNAADPNAASSNAAAAATQTAPGNSNVVVRVGSPGDVGAVNQSNDAQSQAGASSDPSGQAAAQTTQTSPSNVNVVVRVGSPGDNGTVTQQNTATATAGSDAPTPVTAGGSAGSGSTQQSVPTTGDVTGQNGSSTDQSIVQEQDGSAPLVGEDPTLASGSGDPSGIGSATVTQTGATNVNVSVRVGSPGTDGTVTQQNTATATGSTPDLSVVSTDGGSNTNVSIVIPGGPTSDPGSDWTWNWVWDSSTTPPADATTDGSDWSWVWSDTAAPADASGTATAGGPTDQPTTPTPAGTFTWTWTWTMPDGTTVTRSVSQPCDCNWNWTWTWDWSNGAPASTPADGSSTDAAQPQAPAPSTTYDTGAVDQQNTAAANASAGAELLVGQLADQQPGIPGDVSQILVSQQSAVAAASVTQSDPQNANFGFGVATGSVRQANTIEADAVAFDHLDATQVTIQQATTADGTEQSLTATNWAGVQQTAVAYAEADSAGTANVNLAWAPRPNHAAVGDVAQWNGAASSALSVNWAGTLQWIQQFQTAGTATGQQMIAVNLLVDQQSAFSLALAAQLQVVNLNELAVPAGSRATNPSITQSNIDTASAGSISVDETQQWISQTQSGMNQFELSQAGNQSWTTQSNNEQVTGAQLQLSNVAGWLGIEPGPAPASAPAPVVEAPRQFTPSLVTQPVVEPDPAPLHGAPPWRTWPAVAAGVPRPHGHHIASFAPPAGRRPVIASRPGRLAVLAEHSRPTVSHRHLRHSKPAAPRRVTRGGASLPPGGNPVPPGAAGLGSSGSAPSQGSGPVGSLTRSSKLAAPAHFGPRTPAPALGPPAAFLDPFERPG